MGGESFLDGFPFFSLHLVPQNVGNIIFVCYFLNIGLGPKKNQWSRHLFEKSIPGLFYSKPPRKVSATELELRTTKLKKPKKKTDRPTCFQTLTFLVQSGVHPPGFSKDFPWISQGFSMDFPPHGFWIFGEAAGAADKKQDWTPRPNLQAA